MPHSELHKVIIEFLREIDPSAEGLSQAIEHDGDFSNALSALWAERQLDAQDRRNHFHSLDESYGARILDIFQKSTEDLTPEHNIVSLMKAALDDLDEHKPEQLPALQFLSDDVLMEFLSEEE